MSRRTAAIDFLWTCARRRKGDNNLIPYCQHLLGQTALHGMGHYTEGKETYKRLWTCVECPGDALHKQQLLDSLLLKKMDRMQL